MDDSWLQALKDMSYGMYVLTSGTGDRIGGMIASWVSQVSYEPPLIMVAVHPNRYTHTLIQECGGFVLHVPAQEQAKVLSRFKGPDPKAKFSGLEWRVGQTGCPVLSDCLAWIECRVSTTWTPGNHTLFVGHIVQARSVGQGRPLTTLDYQGMYVGKD